jgi:hypothetical protein
VSPRGGNSPMTATHLAAMVAVGVVGAIVAFWVIGGILSFFGFIIKIAIIVALIGGAFWLVGKIRR